MGIKSLVTAPTFEISFRLFTIILLLVIGMMLIFTERILLVFVLSWSIFAIIQLLFVVGTVMFWDS